MEDRRYIIFYQLLNAVGKLPEASFLQRCDFFFFNNLHAIRQPLWQETSISDESLAQGVPRI